MVRIIYCYVRCLKISAPYWASYPHRNQYSLLSKFSQHCIHAADKLCKIWSFHWRFMYFSFIQFQWLNHIPGTKIRMDFWCILLGWSTWVVLRIYQSTPTKNPESTYKSTPIQQSPSNEIVKSQTCGQKTQNRRSKASYLQKTQISMLKMQRRALTCVMTIS